MFLLCSIVIVLVIVIIIFKTLHLKDDLSIDNTVTICMNVNSYCIMSSNVSCDVFEHPLVPIQYELVRYSSVGINGKFYRAVGAQSHNLAICVGEKFLLATLLYQYNYCILVLDRVEHVEFALSSLNIPFKHIAILSLNVNSIFTSESLLHNTTLVFMPNSTCELSKIPTRHITSSIVICEMQRPNKAMAEFFDHVQELKLRSSMITLKGMLTQTYETLQPVASFVIRSHSRSS